MSSVVLIDYGSGNLRSAEKALQAVAARLPHPPAVVTTDDPDAIAAAERLVLPGVGAFRACMDALNARPGVVEAMAHAARARARPFLGVCVGMQLLATRGLEFGEAAGLGWIAGDVARLAPADGHAKVPHMGWNTLRAEASSSLIRDGDDMYFTHSYVFRPADSATVVATADHGGRFAAAVQMDNLAGVQFHPEKSQAAGLELIARFLRWAP